MARARDPNRSKAFEIYKEHAGNIDLVEIASQLNISPGTIRGWKSKDSWEEQLNGTLHKNTERSKRKKGGQLKNKNAVGNDGGAPEQNKNAEKYGFFSKYLPKKPGRFFLPLIMLIRWIFCGIRYSLLMLLSSEHSALLT